MFKHLVGTTDKRFIDRLHVEQYEFFADGGISFSSAPQKLIICAA
jgi:hypothetical protein